MKKNTLHAGYAQADITPSEGIQLAGGPFGAAERILHPLSARALALENGCERLLIISCDLLALDGNFASTVRRMIARQQDIAFDAIMLAATHTHGAPATVNLGEWGKPAPRYMQGLQATLTGLAAEAFVALRPACAGAAAGACPGVGVNRTKSLTPAMDERLAVIRIDEADGKPLAALVNFGCHPVNLHSTGVVTPDWPHYLDLGVPVLFTLGACGDVNPANFRRGQPGTDEQARETAAKVSAAARRLYESIDPSADAELGFCIVDANLSLQPSEQGAEKAAAVAVQAIRIGNAGMVCLPGEPYAIYGKALAAAGGLPLTFTVALANGCIGYFPAPDAYERKSYEAVEVPCRLGRQPFTSDCGRIICAAATQALRMLPHLTANGENRHQWGRACNVIPGGGQAHKRPVKYMYQGGPGLAARASGARFWDADGREYLDYLLAYGPIVLGHCDPDVNRAVREQMERGTLFSVESPLLTELAEKLAEIIPCCEMMVPFIGGSATTTGALRCARAHTGRELIIRCGYHGWHDWCFAEERGVPLCERELILRAPYNDLAALQLLFEQHPGKIAGVIIEAVQMDGPAPEYFKGVRRICDQNGAVFILDEVKTGFRFALGGAQERFDIDCDLATFGKAMCNGYPGSVLVGKRAVLEARSDTFMAATFHGDLLSVAAALTVIRIMQERNGVEYMCGLGTRLMKGLDEAFKATGYPLKTFGLPQMPCVTRDNAPPELRGRCISEWCAAMQRRGIFINGHVWFLSLAHTEADIDMTIERAADAAREAMAEMEAARPRP